MTSHERAAKANIKRWERSDEYRLGDAYTDYSYKKEKAFEYCKKLCEKHNGRNLKIVSHNSFVFTAGFEYTDPETGVLMYMHITPSYDQAVQYII